MQRPNVPQARQPQPSRLNRPRGTQAGAASSPTRQAPARGTSTGHWYARRLRRRIVSAIACVISAVVISYVAVTTPAGQALDTLFMEAAIRWSDSAGNLTHLITSIASVPVMIIVGAIVFVVAVIRRRPTLAGRAMFVVIGANATTQIAKYLLDRPNLGVTTVVANSLPSGHTTVAMAIALALVMVAPPWLRAPSAWVGWVWTALMGISVMISAWHRIADVVVAFLICGAWALALAPIEHRTRHIGGMRAYVAMALVIGFIVASILTVVALAGVDVSAVANPGPSGYGFAEFLEESPSRARILAIAGTLWVVVISGWVIDEVDSLSGNEH